MTEKSLNRWTAIVLIVEALLLFVPTIVLGSAIDWPASLDEPASVMLPRLIDQEAAVRSGYFVYLVYSILFWPVTLLLIRAVARQDVHGPLLKLAAGFGIASAALRTLGIIRWLAPMPALADQYTAEGVSAATQETISIVYRMLNDYAGSIGEVLGVGVFAALSLGLIAWVIVRDAGRAGGSLPRWLGVTGLITAVLLGTAILEAFGVDMGPFSTVSVVALQFWLLAAGIILWRRKAA